MLQCYRDIHGFLRVDIPSHPTVASYLEQDIQTSAERCKEVLTAATEVQTQQRKQWESTGNAFTVTIASDRVTIENIWDESMAAAKLTLPEFTGFLNEWLACISKRP